MGPADELRAEAEEFEFSDVDERRDAAIVVSSSGDADSSRAEGFRSLVLLDEGFAAGAAFGVDGTPMAVLLGADGRVASSVAAGADAVLELAH